MGCQSLYPACWWARGVRRRGRAGADPGLRVCLFVCVFVCLLVRAGFGGWSGSEFRGKDRTKRFRRARSTFSSVEVGSDSLNSATSLAGILGTARNHAGWARPNPAPGDFLAVHLDALLQCLRHRFASFPTGLFQIFFLTEWTQVQQMQ